MSETTPETPETAPDSGVKSPKKQKAKKKPDFVVVVGASAGGLEALEEFFRIIPEKNNLAFVVIQHLSPDFESMMDELLARHTKMTIQRARTGVSLAGGQIYVMIPRKNLIVENGKLKLLEPNRTRGLNLPIDIMLDSLALDSGKKAIGVILSGAGRDGTKGIEAIKDAGGFVLAQDETTAKFDSMPRSAVATGLVDYVGSPLELGQHILRLTEHPDAKPLAEKPLVAPNSNKLEEIINIIRTGTEFDFSNYKTGTLSRRIERRMGALQLQNLDDYIDFLIESMAEREELARDMLIGVTRFFRDPEMWMQLQQTAIKPILQESNKSEDVRAWVAACSTGEEAYSLAICFKEMMEDLDIQRNVKIFASDIDPHSIATAGSGLFPERVAGEISAERLGKNFIKRGNEYEIIRPIREMIIFARHNILTDAPFTRLHLATCRNMLIYLDNDAQKRALTNLHFGLGKRGYLFIGPSESLGTLSDIFVTANDAIKCFQKHPHIRNKMAVNDPMPSLGTRLSQPSRRASQTETRSKSDALLIKALEYIVEKIDYPGMLVSHDNHLIYSFGNLQGLLAVPKGDFSPEVTKLVRSEVQVPLSAGLRRASSSRQEVVYKDIVIEENGASKSLSLIVDPIKVNDSDSHTYLVLFKKDDVKNGNATGQNDGRVVTSNVSAEEIDLLELELKSTKETLQATIEELETANEELQSSNEELIASNEELQSTNEELHSVNEELQTVNTEYQAKIDELKEISEDFENLMISTNIGTIFLDNDLRIRKFTRGVTEVMDLIDHDIGRKIDQFRTSFSEIGFVESIKRVIRTGKPYIQEIQTTSKLSYMMRILPFKSSRGPESGVVINFVDITSLERAGAALFEAETRFEDLFHVNPLPTSLIAKGGKVVRVNQSWIQTFGFSETEIVGRHINSFFNLKPQAGEDESRGDLLTALLDSDQTESIDALGLKKSGDTFAAGLIFKENKDGTGYLVAQDKSEIQIVTQTLNNAINDLRTSNLELEQFGSVVAHDLKEPLRTVRGFGKLLRQDLKDHGIDYADENLDKIDTGVERMQEMIDDLMSFATIISDDSNTIEVPVDKIIHEVKKIMKTKIEQTGTSLTVHEMPSVRVRPSQIIHVFQNLIENAIKYRSDAPPNIVVSAEKLGSNWRFCVQDNGIGIKDPYKDKIFDIFKRLHSKGQYSGTGIGLAIVKKIITNHGGKIWVESEFGVGSRFYFTLNDMAYDA